MYYDGSVIKIMDFNYAIRIKEGRFLRDGVGIPYYVSPEMIKGRYDLKTDVWSLGVMMYLMLKGIPPYMGNSQNQILEAIKNFKIDLSAEENMSEEAKDIL